ncbi:BDR-repeat family protein (plasmid) [Borrelia nietonii YOR]|uniref:BDR-repeat family protein n=2 Tax=Borrelia TaxID=138 RepID=W5SB77_9SPIR|nr:MULTISPECIES: Bdr family repetitive protein [Borrelia]AHH04212.1 BDR-repeat family protein [Borrelia nietonii YOR]AHH14394.1 BDR-repeat family protein [Borrelia hermsii MTW]UPA10049.1 hypothetical protein bhYOR_001402 [Borrelia nietonii YOR]
MRCAQPVITQQMVLSELVKAGINRDIAADLFYRYCRNELTHKDIEHLRENFDIKLEMLERGLKADINELGNKIDTVRNELKFDIKDLDNKIDINKMELKSTLRLYNWMFGTPIALNIGIFLALISMLSKQLSVK